MTIVPVPAEHCWTRGARTLGVSCGAVSGESGRARMLEAMRHVADHGASLLDTSDAYGRGGTERLIGEFLRSYPQGHLRLSTRVGRVRGTAPHPYAGRHVSHQLEQSLENLDTEVLDLYTLESHDFGPGDCHLGTVIGQMRAFRELGYIRAIGLRGPRAWWGHPQGRVEADRFLALFRAIKPDMVWVPFGVGTPAIEVEGEDLFSFASRHGVGLVLALPGAGTGCDEITAGSHVMASSRGTGFEGRRRVVSDAGLTALRERFGRQPGAVTEAALRFSLRRAATCVVLVGLAGMARGHGLWRGLAHPLSAQDDAFAEETYARIRARTGGDGALPADRVPT